MAHIEFRYHCNSTHFDVVVVVVYPLFSLPERVIPITDDVYFLRLPLVCTTCVCVRFFKNIILGSCSGPISHGLPVPTFNLISVIFSPFCPSALLFYLHFNVNGRAHNLYEFIM